MRGRSINLIAGATLRWDGAGAFTLSNTNREISSDTAGSGTETEEARSMANLPSRDLPGQSLRIRIVDMSYTLIVCEIDAMRDRSESRQSTACANTSKEAV
jgi:hypothetical protein